MDRFVDKCGKNIEEVVVGNGEAAMQLIDPQQGPLPSVAVVPPLEQLAYQNVRVVVALLGTIAEFSRAIQQGRDTRNAKCAEESEFQRPGRVEGKCTTRREEDDPLMVLLRIELLDFFKNGVP